MQAAPWSTPPKGPGTALRLYLAGLQAEDGHWCAELTADTTLESDFILFQLWLYPPEDGRWRPETRPLSIKPCDRSSNASFPMAASTSTKADRRRSARR